jgi:hypothetical protein
MKRTRAKKINPMEKCSVTISPDQVEAINQLVEVYNSELEKFYKNKSQVTFSSVLRELIRLGVESEYKRLGLV